MSDYHDTPPCPACGQQCVVGIAQIAWWRPQNPEHRLWCSRCGHAYVGTDAEVAQAAAADAAFDRLETPALAADEKRT